MTKGARERRDDLTPEQEQGGFSTGGAGFEESLPRVLAGGAEIDETGGSMGEHSGLAPPGLTDEEVIREVQRLRAGVMDGSVPVFFDGESARRYWSERFGG